jgi:hypothetical protein
MWGTCSPRRGRLTHHSRSPDHWTVVSPVLDLGKRRRRAVFHVILVPVNRPLTLLAAALCLASLSCSSSKSSTATPASDAGFVPFPASPTTFDMNFTVGPSSEDFECTYVTMPSTAGFIIGGQHEYTVGSHHLLIYRTNLTSIPAGEASPTLGGCYEGTADYMSTITGAVYPAATPTGELTMPPGVGLPFSANEIFLFQVHYLNATATPIDAHVSVHLTTQTTPVQQNAGVIFFYDPFIYVPQGAGSAVASMRCPIPQNITMFTEGSHYHARGVNYQAYLDTPSAPASSPFYTSNNWASPTIQLDTMQVEAGSYIRYYCDYDNTQGTQDYIQGPSAEYNEMCMYIGLYYPAMDPADEQCESGDTYGTGTTSCTDTLNCLSACPPDDAGAQGINFSQCIQQCFVASCPNASAPLLAALNCIQSSCSSQCATQGSECTSCITASCASQYEACASATCGTVPSPPN